MARHGWIEPVETARYGGRPERTVYARTEAGDGEFVRWIDELIRTPAPEYPKLLAAVSYLGALGPDGASDALAERAGHLERRIEETSAVLADTVGSGQVPRLFMIEVECARHAWEAELAGPGGPSPRSATAAWPGPGANRPTRDDRRGIVGAGPAGLLLVSELRLAGVAAVVIERDRQRPDYCRGFNLNARALDLLTRRGLADGLIEEGWQVPHAAFSGLPVTLGLAGVAPTVLLAGHPANPGRGSPRGPRPRTRSRHPARARTTRR